MKSNQITPDALAQDGLQITERQLLIATQNIRTDANSATMLQVAPPRDLTAPDWVSWKVVEPVHGPDDTGAATQPLPIEEMRNRGLMGRMLGALRLVLLSPFKAVREVYWFLDPDSKVRSQGLRTVGSVIATCTTSKVVRPPESDTDQIIYTHHVTYGFDANGDTHSREQKVESLGNLKEGSLIRVYYLPNTDPPKSAISPEPRAVV